MELTNKLFRASYGLTGHSGPRRVDTLILFSVDIEVAVLN